MSLSIQSNTRKKTRKLQLSQFDPAILMMLPDGVPVLPIP